MIQTDNYAMLETDSNYVENTIVADNNFSVVGFKLIKIEVDTFCQSGMYFNDNDDLFYDDENFTSINNNPASK
ncbi:hypothetical protein ACMV5I_10655 [Serratia sp. T13T92]|uniref:hypothetical protein n=1 Tax=Serratia sp. T13T92 TaxID=3397496 RepID=UPI0039E0FBF0